MLQTITFNTPPPPLIVVFSYAIVVQNHPLFSLPLSGGHSQCVSRVEVKTAGIWVTFSYGTKINFYERKTTNGDY